jgi:hypothetical protein
MYNSPLYGKEWAWRNVKMEAQEVTVFFGHKAGKGFAARAANPFFIAL